MGSLAAPLSVLSILDPGRAQEGIGGLPPVIADTSIWSRSCTHTMMSGMQARATGAGRALNTTSWQTTLP